MAAAATRTAPAIMARSSPELEALRAATLAALWDPPRLAKVTAEGEAAQDADAEGAADLAGEVVEGGADASMVRGQGGHDGPGGGGHGQPDADAEQAEGVAARPDPRRVRRHSRRPRPGQESRRGGASYTAAAHIITSSALTGLITASYAAQVAALTGAHLYEIPASSC
jgi:hypothetical protein